MLSKPRLRGIQVSPSDMNVSHAKRTLLQVLGPWNSIKGYKWGSHGGRHRLLDRANKLISRLLVHSAWPGTF